MANIQWRGVFPALTTKFTAADEIDWAAMEQHLSFQLDAGVHGLIILGSLGRTPPSRRTKSSKRSGSSPAPSGAASPWWPASPSPRRAKRRLLPVLPRTPGPMLSCCCRRCATPVTAARHLTYLQEVAAATPLPIMLYNNPIAYGTDLTPSDFARLADNARFEAIKESAADTRRIAEIRRLVGDRFALFCGVDDLAYECFALGAVGWVAGPGRGISPRDSALVGAVPGRPLGGSPRTLRMVSALAAPGYRAEIRSANQTGGITDGRGQRPGSRSAPAAERGRGFTG